MQYELKQGKKIFIPANDGETAVRSQHSLEPRGTDCKTQIVLWVLKKMLGHMINKIMGSSQFLALALYCCGYLYLSITINCYRKHSSDLSVPQEEPEPFMNSYEPQKHYISSFPPSNFKTHVQYVLSTFSSFLLFIKSLTSLVQ